jgi:hypothetical protein
MIRRDDREDWLIIDQIEHARLAGELARVWGDERSGLFALFPKLVWGVSHHDDGWSAWDAAPRLHPKTGFPRSFLEMRMRDSTAIWTRSIAVCSADPLAAVAVSRHFCHLAGQVRDSGRADADDLESIDRFLHEQSVVQLGLADEARATGAGAEANGNLEKSFDLGCRTVQFFDRVSLWLCCAPRQQPEQFAAPLGETVRLIPNNPAQIAVEPYPLCVDSLLLETPARRIAARRYANDAELQTALRAAPTERLSWMIGPA